jgi:hypothetical protein
MNKILLLLLSVTCCNYINAQKPASYVIHQVYPGYVLTATTDTMAVYVQNGDDKSNQVSCRYYYFPEDTPSNRIYKPIDIDGYAIGDKHDHTVDFNASGNKEKPSRMFLLVDKPGPITSYFYYANKQQKVWRKGKGEAISLDGQKDFTTNILKLVGDDTMIAGKIKRKENEYTFANVTTIIEGYNKRHSGNIGK